MKANATRFLTAAAALAGLIGLAAGSAADHPRRDEASFSNEFGVQRTISLTGFDTSNPFFEDLGTNGRTCFSCHRPGQGWTVTPDELGERFKETEGLDPIFRTNDGSNCEGADTSTLAKRREAFSQLLNKGLIRIGSPFLPAPNLNRRRRRPVPRWHALTEASMRRPPLTTNLGFLSTSVGRPRDRQGPGHARGSDHAGVRRDHRSRTGGRSSVGAAGCHRGLRTRSVHRAAYR